MDSCQCQWFPEFQGYVLLTGKKCVLVVHFVANVQMSEGNIKGSHVELILFSFDSSTTYFPVRFLIRPVYLSLRLVHF